MPPKEERLMKAMKWIIPALFLGLGMLGLCFFLDTRPVPPPASPVKEEEKSPKAETENETTDTPSPDSPLSPAQQRLSEMTLEEKLGQVFLLRCPLAEERPEVEALAPGGVLLFGRDFEGKDAAQVKADTESWQQNAKTPILFAVDEEGGTVCRVSGNPGLRAEKFLSPRQAYAQGGWETVEQDTREKSALLNALGIRLNLAPVADLSDDPQDFIHPRSFGGDAGQVAQFVRQAVTWARQEGVASALKHFPGYGSNVDTHTGLSWDSRTLEELESRDLLPFQAGIRTGAACVLVSHNVVDALERGVPASLSPQTYRYLREEMDFSGVAITDDLVMGAIQDYCGGESAAPQALTAGADLLIVSDLPADYAALRRAVEEGRVSMERLDEAVLRVLELKAQLGLLS